MCRLPPPCRRLLLGAGWLAAGARRRGGTAPRRSVLLLLRRWHLLLGALAAYKLLRLGLAALRSLLFGRAERWERARLALQLKNADSYESWLAAAVRLDELTTQCQAHIKPKLVRGWVSWARRARRDPAGGAVDRHSSPAARIHPYPSAPHPHQPSCPTFTAGARPARPGPARG